MRDAAGQAPNRLELLRLRELVLQFRTLIDGPFVVTDVPRGSDRTYGTALWAFTSEERPRADADPPLRAIAPDNAVFEIEESAGLPVVHSRNRGTHALDIVRMNEVEECRQQDRLVLRNSPDRALLSRPVADVADEVVVEDADLRCANDLRQPVFALAEGELGLFAARDVAHDALNRGDAAIGVAQRLHDGARPEFNAVDEEMIFGLQRPAAVDDLPHTLAECGRNIRREHFVDRPAGELFRRQAEVGRGFRVAVQVASVAIADEDRIVRRLDDRAVRILNQSCPSRLSCPSRPLFPIHRERQQHVAGHEAERSIA